MEDGCNCPACRQFSRAYLHHVVKSGEIIAAMLLTWHNLTYYQRLMGALRQAIADLRLADWLKDYRAKGSAPETDSAENI